MRRCCERLGAVSGLLVEHQHLEVFLMAELSLETVPSDDAQPSPDNGQGGPNKFVA